MTPVSWLTPQRIIAQACLLLVCLWAVAIFDFSTSGVIDRAGNVKFQDFLPTYLATKALHADKPIEMYDWQLENQREHAIAPQWKYAVPMVYGPQVAWCFEPLAESPFLRAASVWTGLSLLFYLACCYLLLRTSALRENPRVFWLLALAYPPLFHFAVRGQMSAVPLLCFTLAFLAWRADHSMLAGIALGFLIFKPPFLVAIPVVLLLAGSWRALGGMFISAVGQLWLTWACFGTTVMREYVTTLMNLPRLSALTEGRNASIQMHSLRAFWDLLIPWPHISLAFYAASSLAVIWLALRSWKSEGPLSVRFSSLLLATVLVNPHLYVYDLLALMPVFILLADWMLRNSDHPSSAKLKVLLYGAYVLPLFGPLSLVTHVQISIVIFALLQWEILCLLDKPLTFGRKQLSQEEFHKLTPVCEA
jgi:hypothetical protein